MYSSVSAISDVSSSFAIPCQNVISTGPDASSSAPVGQPGWSASGDSVVVGAIVAGVVSDVDPVESVGVEPPGDPLWTVDGGAVDATVSGSSRPACNADFPDPQAAATTAPTAIIATARPTRRRAIIP